MAPLPLPLSVRPSFLLPSYVTPWRRTRRAFPACSCSADSGGATRCSRPCRRGSGSSQAGTWRTPKEQKENKNWGVKLKMNERKGLGRKDNNKKGPKNVRLRPSTGGGKKKREKKILGQNLWYVGRSTCCTIYRR